MSKKILVKEGGIGRFLQSFFIAKAKGRDDEFIKKLHKPSPELSKMMDDFNDKLDSNVAWQYKWLKSNGYSTADLDDYIKKYNVSI
jgi:hypothetical protein